MLNLIFNRILIIFFIIYTPTLYAQDVALKEAEKFYKLKNYNAAITEYKRFIFFNPQYNRKSKIYYKIGICYMKSGDWDKAIKFFNMTTENSTDEKWIEKVKLKKVVVYLAKKDFNIAEFQLLKIISFAKYPETIDNAYFFLGLLYTFTFRWEKAKEAFITFLKRKRSSETQNIVDEVKAIFEESKNLNYKTPELSKWLSVFIPGSGQIYSGNFLNGINAFVINSAIFYLIIDNILTGNYSSAALDFLFLFRRYYFGNVDNAYKLAKKHNQIIDLQFQNKILNFIHKMLGEISY